MSLHVRAGACAKVIAGLPHSYKYVVQGQVIVVIRIKIILGWYLDDHDILHELTSGFWSCKALHSRLEVL